MVDKTFAWSLQIQKTRNTIRKLIKEILDAKPRIIGSSYYQLLIEITFIESIRLL